MGWYVHVHVSFACDENEPVAEVAKKHAERHATDGGSDAECAARWFLDGLSERTGANMGPKGGLSLWGMTGNHTSVSEFCERLRPFWLELLQTPKCGPLDFEHIVVFEEQEQSGQAIAYEIYLDEPARSNLMIRRHELPFCWNQF
jgi:hypothetical protein